MNEKSTPKEFHEIGSKTWSSFKQEDFLSFLTGRKLRIIVNGLIYTALEDDLSNNSQKYLGWVEKCLRLKHFHHKFSSVTTFSEARETFRAKVEEIPQD